ncbi:MFS transporter [Candidatus Bipolaricaulota bacterium]|nr:MFS transporter [Candidatus Bipolaricaulota bacterium]
MTIDRGFGAEAPFMRSSNNGSNVLWLVTACTALSLFGDSALYAVLPSQFDRFGLVVLQVGWLLSVNRLVRLPLNIPSGWLMRRFGPKWPLVIGLSLGSLSTLGFGLFRAFWALLACRCLWGVSWALIVVASYGFVLASTDPASRGRSTGIYTSFARFGGALGAMIGGFLLDVIGTLPTMTVLASCGGGAVLLALLLPNSRDTRLHSVSSRTRATSIRLLEWVRRLRKSDSTLWIVFLYNFIHLLVFSGIFYSTFGLYLRSAVGETITAGGVVIGVASLTGSLLFARNVFGLISSPLVGALSDRTGRRARALVVAESFGALSLVLLAIDRSPVMLISGIVIASVSYGLAPALLLAWLGDLSKGRSGVAIGGFQTAGDLGSGLGPLVAYPLVAWIGIHATYAAAAALIVLAAILVFRTDRRSSKMLARCDG